LSILILFVVILTLSLILWVIRRETQVYVRARRRKARHTRQLRRRLRRVEQDQ
jgi:hypothetical protein